jgi:hypothetical protein
LTYQKIIPLQPEAPKMLLPPQGVSMQPGTWQQHQTRQYHKTNNTKKENISAAKYQCSKMPAQQIFSAAKYLHSKISLDQNISLAKYQCVKISVKQGLKFHVMVRFWLIRALQHSLRSL